MYAIWYPKLTAFHTVTAYAKSMFGTAVSLAHGHLKSRMHIRKADSLSEQFRYQPPPGAARRDRWTQTKSPWKFSELTFAGMSFGSVATVPRVPASAAGIDGEGGREDGRMITSHAMQW
jgi:hypothetical protein